MTLKDERGILRGEAALGARLTPLVVSWAQPWVSASLDGAAGGANPAATLLAAVRGRAA